MMVMAFIDQLRQLGLSSGEARVYISLLGLYAPSKVGLIVRESHVSYSKVYDVLRRLIEKGLVSYVMINNIKYFTAVEPYRLFDYIQRKEAEIKEQRLMVERIVPELTDLIERDIKKATSVTKKRQAEIFTGDRGLRTAYEILLGGYDNNNNDNTIDLVKSGTNRISSTNSTVEHTFKTNECNMCVLDNVTIVPLYHTQDSLSYMSSRCNYCGKDWGEFWISYRYICSPLIYRHQQKQQLQH